MGSDARLAVLRRLRFVVGSWKEDGRTDVELLARFVQTRDEQAFATLVGRYAELVWGVCLRVLRNAADAEDALQATFLRPPRASRPPPPWCGSPRAQVGPRRTCGSRPAPRPGRPAAGVRVEVVRIGDAVGEPVVGAGPMAPR
jgi:hypothetical protein